MKQPHNALKEQAVVITVLISIVIVVLFMLNRQDAKMLTSVKNGSTVLECHFKDGWRVVSPDRVTDYWDGRWFFDNGSASQCILK